jgi:trans-aconitate 2-methyltransferase
MIQVASPDGWLPEQYAKFAAERARPFYDLLDLVTPVPGGEVVDLGCGTGELTAELHRRTQAAGTTGIDNSPAMLAEAAAHAGGAVRFTSGDITTFDPGPAAYDVVFANASLQWVPDHRALLARLTAMLRPGGQLCVQVPSNADHASHRIASAVATEAPFCDAMGGTPPPDAVLGVLKPEAYAELLDELGFTEQHVRLQVYGHHLPSTAAVVEWTKGTTLVRFRRLLTPELFDRFVEVYRSRLLAEVGDHEPYFYAFKRILFRARLEIQ